MYASDLFAVRVMSFVVMRTKTNCGRVWTVRDLQRRWSEFDPANVFLV